MLRTYEIWVEGYSITGERAQAEFLGKTRAVSFEEACRKLMQNSGQSVNYNSESNTVYGCRLFDNEEDARRSFG